MIYLIGGAPKCGKTTLAKKLSQKLKISWVSSDTLEVVAMDYVWKYAPEKFDMLYPHSAMKGKNNDETYSLFSPTLIAKNYLVQAKATHAAIDMFSICEIKDGHDYIIEGYHVTPQLAAKLIKKYGREHIRALFLIKKDTEKFVKDIEKTTTQNDWIIKNTKHKDTYNKIAEMVKHFSVAIEKEAKKYDLPMFYMDEQFTDKIKRAISSLTHS